MYNLKKKIMANRAFPKISLIIILLILILGGIFVWYYLPKGKPPIAPPKQPSAIQTELVDLSGISTEKNKFC